MAPQGLSAFSSLLQQLYSATAVSFAEHLHQVLAQHFCYDVFRYEEPEATVSRRHPRSRFLEPNGSGAGLQFRRQTRRFDGGDVQLQPAPSAIDTGHVLAARTQPRRFETVISLTGEPEPRIVLTRFNRGFSCSERAWMDLLGPHVGQLYRAARTAGRPAQPSVPFRHQAPTHRMMENTVGEVENPGKAAPLPGFRFARALGPGLAEARHPAALNHGDSNKLRFRAAAPAPAVAAAVPLPGSGSAVLEGLGLTVREAEVLLWVSRGKTNDDIAIILNISGRTVGKHMEHIASKLNVETRTSAAAIALEVLSPGTLAPSLGFPGRTA